MSKSTYKWSNIRLLGLFAVLAVVVALATTSFVAASPSEQSYIPGDAVVLERLYDPETGDVVSVSLVYQDSSGAYMYAEGNATGIVTERSATYQEIQRYLAHQVVSTPPAGESTILAWVENRTDEIDDCIVFVQNYQVASQAQQVAAQAELGECVETLLRVDKQVIKYLVNTLVINGVLEP